MKKILMLLILFGLQTVSDAKAERIIGCNGFNNGVYLEIYKYSENHFVLTTSIENSNHELKFDIISIKKRDGLSHVELNDYEYEKTLIQYLNSEKVQTENFESVVIKAKRNLNSIYLKFDPSKNSKIYFFQNDHSEEVICSVY